MNSKGEKDEFIEVWRGVAVFLVVYFHFANRLPYTAVGSATPPSLEFYAGKIGVYIFFVISGFLIAQSLAGSRNLAEFYAKRVSRIYPLFVFASIVIFVFLTVFQPPVVPDGPRRFYSHERTLLDLVGTILMLEDLGFRWIDGVFWSILVELKFYLFIGLFAVAFRRNYIEAFSWAAALLAALDFFLILFVPPEYGRLPSRILHGVMIAHYAPFFAVGLLLFLRKRGMLLTVNSLLCCVQVLIALHDDTDFNVLRTAQFVCVLAIALVIDTQFFKSRVFLFLGTYSYSIYLFHQMIGLTIISRMTPMIGIDGAIAVALAVIILISWAASKLVEWRFRRQVASLIMSVLAVAGLQRATFAVAPQGAAVQRT
jgi:peptidoglycan/LPS O-acetylase OafA/YrhL